MTEVIKNTENFITIQNEWIIRLKDEAKKSPKRHSRLCMHEKEDDEIQEMLVVFCNNCIVKPSNASGRAQSFDMVEGEMLLILFDDSGRVTDCIEMGTLGSGKTFIYRLSRPTWHTLIPRSNFVVVHECIKGPFSNLNTPLPRWIPESLNQLKIFLDQILQKSAYV